MGVGPVKFRAIAGFGSGDLGQQIRLISGLILLVFVFTHLINAALGLISIEAMEVMQVYRRGFWRSAPGTVLLFGSLGAHIIMVLWKVARRRTLRMPVWEAVQLGLGLAIPWQLMRHILATRGLYQVFGVDDTYIHELSLLWPSEMITQSLLIFFVWGHAMLGLHFWLRMAPWYPKIFQSMFAVAVLLPVLAALGWINAAREVALFYEVKGLTPEQITAVLRWMDIGQTALAVIGALLAAVLLGPWLIKRLKRRISIEYPGGNIIRVNPGPTLLEISRANGIPHASVCGGRARCSTCRVAVLSGGQDLAAPEAAESLVLTRIGADERTRLACQIRPQHDLVIQPLMPARGAENPDKVRDAYYWGVEQPVAIIFADIRNFTGLAEEKLPFDVVFLLNRYCSLMAGAIIANGGYVDKFIGDGVMAIFGITDGITVGCRNALAAAAAMGAALDELNAEIVDGGGNPIKMGVGIHAGPAILGRIGAAGGDGSAGGITALGDTVNAASRLETATKKLDTVVISLHVLKAAKVELPNGAEHEITVKGRSAALKVISVGKFTDISAALKTDDVAG
ncbi:MAG: adenylate/guanylate cyclase domain-containing protein [Alphaproteobacteria bacterium]